MLTLTAFCVWSLLKQYYYAEIKTSHPSLMNLKPCFVCYEFIFFVLLDTWRHFKHPFSLCLGILEIKFNLKLSNLFCGKNPYFLNYWTKIAWLDHKINVIVLHLKCRVKHLRSIEKCLEKKTNNYVIVRLRRFARKLNLVRKMSTFFFSISFLHEFRLCTSFSCSLALF